MTPNVYTLLQARDKAAGSPTAGWVFPSEASEGHFNGDAAKDQHSRALKDSGVQRFEPYILRHTALTNLAKRGADAHTLARIAGHGSIVITMRYVHPQADAIERAFAMAHGKMSGKRPSRAVRSPGKPEKTHLHVARIQIPSNSVLGKVLRLVPGGGIEPPGPKPGGF
jgi:hypothetical protein